MAKVSDIIGESERNKSSRPIDRTQLDYLRDIDQSLKQILKNGGSFSESNAVNGIPGKRNSGFMGGDNGPFTDSFFRAKHSARRGAGGFLDSFEQSLFEGVLGKDFKDNLRDVFGNFADQLGVSISEIPSQLGKNLGDQVMSWAKGTSFGKDLISKIDGLKKKSVDWFKDLYDQGVDDYVDKQGGMSPGQKAAKSSDLFKKATTTSETKAKDEEAKRSDSKDSKKGDHGQGREEVDPQKRKDQPASRFQDVVDKFTEQKSPDTSSFEKVKSGPESAIKDELKNRVTDRVTDQLNGLKDKGISKATEVLGKLSNKGGFVGNVAGKSSSLLGKLFGGSSSAAAASGAAASTAGAGAAASGAASTMAAAGSASGAAMAGFGKVLMGITSKLGPYGLAITAGILLLKKLGSAIKPVIDSFKNLVASAKNAANRESKSREQNLKLAQERAKADMKVMIEEPFNILKDAAQKAYDVWDSNLRMITATQGYNKSDLQTLMGSYSDRLRSEGLSSVIGGTDITSNLSKVLESGLSGAVAEEFAYLATKLSAAVPTQDFFSYADTYASLAANAIRQGKSEADAIKYANEQMELFASNVLYASRQISGGFTTGLRNAQSLFDQSVQISQASRSGNPSEIAGVMTSVAAITGAIAPDLAQSMTDAILKAATGGNSSEIVALRSLAGINASNTEFLKQLADNPQKVFSDMFEGLARMQNTSENAWMEVAEGLSSVFGISMDAFARVDFNYLAQAISKMNVNNTSLDENIKLLAAGETTTNAEQLKLAEINKKLVDEGLAYVLDNEAARSIQENMWAEQRQRELMEATYAVELAGSSLEFLESIKGFVEKITNFLNPFAWLKKLGNLIATGDEAIAQKADIVQMLELGKVGGLTGNRNLESLYQLTTHNANLNVADKLVNMMGGVSLYGLANQRTKLFNSFTNPMFANNTGIGTGQILSRLAQNIAGNLTSNNISSNYRWDTLGKSQQEIISSGTSSIGPAPGISQIVNQMQSKTNEAQEQADGNIQRMIDELGGKLEADKGLTYENWMKSAKNYGIANFEAAAKMAGYTQEQLREYFSQKETEQVATEKNRRDEREEEMWGRLVFDGDSLWHLVDQGNITRVELLSDQKAYHMANILLTQHANKTRDQILQEMQLFGTGSSELLRSGNEVRSQIRHNALIYYTLYSDLTSYANETRDSMKQSSIAYYQDYIDYTDHANVTRDNMALAAESHYATYIDLTESANKIRENMDLAATSYYSLYETMTTDSHNRLDLIHEVIEAGNGVLSNINDKLSKFYDSWVDFYITQYNDAVSQTKLANEIAKLDKNDSRDAIYALADVLTKNSLDMQNPAVQTNALLAEILKVLAAIMQQNNSKVDGLSLFDTLSGLSLGLTKSNGMPTAI